MPALGRIARVAAAATLLGAVLPSPGVSAERERGKRSGRYKLGPIWLTPRLKLKNAGVDTNVFNQQTHAIADTSVVLSPGLDVSLPALRRLRLTGTGYLDLNYYRRQRNERSTDFVGAARAELDIGPLTLFGSGGGGQFRQRFSIELDKRILRQEKHGEAGVKWSLGRRLSATLQGTSHVYTFEGGVIVNGADVKRALDRSTLTGQLEALYTVTSRTSLLVSAEAIEDRFLRQLTGTRIAQSRRYLAGVVTGRHAPVSGRLLAGLREFPSTASQGAPPYRGPALAMSVSAPIPAVGRLEALAERDILFAVSPGGTPTDQLRNTYVSTRYRAEVTATLPLDLVGRGVMGVEEARYVLPIPRHDIPTPRMDRVYSAGGSVLRPVGDSLRIGGSITWTRRVSNFEGASYQGMRYGIEAELNP